MPFFSNLVSIHKRKCMWHLSYWVWLV
jgi:hypothetical protein